jgi:hypothetical protein
MTIKPVLVPDHDAADLRDLMNRFSTAAQSATPAAQANRIRQQLTESAEPGVAENDMSALTGLAVGTLGGAVLPLAAGSLAFAVKDALDSTDELAKRKAQVDTSEIISLQRQIVSINKMIGRVKTDATKEKYQNMLKQAYAVLDELKARQGNRVAEARPDVMRHKGDKTIKIVKRAGKPIGEIGTDAEASPGNGQYYVKLYDGSYDAVGYDTAEEALAELKAAIKQGVTEGRAGVDDTDTVGFSVNSEAAYTAVMKRFGDAIDHDETSGIMYAPARIWPRIEMVAFDADGEGAVRDEGIAEDDMPDLEAVGEPVSSMMDAERRMAAGDRIFVAHEMDEEPFEVFNVGDLKGYTYDQMLAVPQDIQEVKHFKTSYGYAGGSKPSGGQYRHPEQTKADSAAKKTVQAQQQKNKQLAVDEAAMSRAAKGNEKYGKTGMAALAQAGREGASKATLDDLRDRYNRYKKHVAEARSEKSEMDTPAVQRAIAGLKQRHEKDPFDLKKAQALGQKLAARNAVSKKKS